MGENEEQHSDEKKQDCNCFVCVFRRISEAEQRKEGESKVEEKVEQKRCNCFYCLESGEDGFRNAIYGVACDEIRNEDGEKVGSVFHRKGLSMSKIESFEGRKVIVLKQGDEELILEVSVPKRKVSKVAFGDIERKYGGCFLGD